MLRWIFLVWLAGCSPRGNTVRQDGEFQPTTVDIKHYIQRNLQCNIHNVTIVAGGAPAVTGVPYNSYQKKGLLFPADPLTAINVVF
ncbi:hypothetical protein KGM_209921 [Danaus plexippus plexippus]|uniref:Uncharacterized protein n=1 Tax=Danaus plexippus plexippus TaxID=278856 RepID=A0A212EWJ4_DANPL|nr:hypothetical protein KGM_209921 [Danaus plexippus plexippus]